MRRSRLLILVLLGIVFPSYGPAITDPTVTARLQDSLQTFSKIMSSPQSAIPPVLLQKAEGIAIIPNMIRASFFVGARLGKGVLIVRDKDRHWSNPVFITINGGSFGLQMGLQSTDLVLVFRRSRALETKAGGDILLGTDVSIVAGTMALHMDENTEADLRAEIYSFSRSTGLNVGFALQGATMRMDDTATATLYGKRGLSAHDALWSKVETASPDVFRFKEGFIRIVEKGT